MNQRTCVFSDVLPQIKSCHIQHVFSNGSLKGGPTLCLFAHFDPAGEIEPYVIHHIECLKAQLGAQTVFISTAPKLVNSREFQRLQELCPYIIHRANTGLDFGSWKTAIDYLGWDKIELFDRLLLANDSVYGPLQDIDNLMLDENSAVPTVVGITESADFKYHLQSYFLLFNKSAILNAQFRADWDEFEFFDSKQKIIFQYELGLSERMARYGFSIKALFSNSDLRTAFLNQKSQNLEAHKYFTLIRDKTPNPTHYLWKQLIESGCPYVKADLLKYNNEQIPDLQQFADVLTAQSNYDIDLIFRHLKRLGTHSISVP